MSEVNNPAFESLEDRCLLSAHMGPMDFMRPMSFGDAGAAYTMPRSQGVGNGHGQSRGMTTGAVVSVDATAGSITVAFMRQGQTTQTTYNVSPTATLMIDGADATLDQFVAGLNVSLKVDRIDPTTVTSIVANGQEVQGRVTAIDTTGGTITLAARRGGAATTYTIGAAPVTVNGQAGALAGIAVGAEADIQFSALDSTAVISVNARFMAPAGQVVSVDPVAGTLTLSTTDHGQATQTTYNVSAAVIAIDGVSSTLDTIVPGMKVVLKTDPTDATVATSIAARSIHVTGRVTAVDLTAGTITLASVRGAAPVTYTIDPSVPITVNGAPGALAGVAVGAQVKIKFSSLDKTTITAVNAHVKSTVGSVVSVDSAAGTITLATTSRGATTQTTYNVSPAATITIDGAAATLDQLVAGVTVVLNTDPMNAAAISSITAKGQAVQGRVAAVDTTNNTITLAGRHQAAGTTYTIGLAVPITINGAAGTLAGITAGSAAEITFSALDNTVVVAVDVRA